MNTLLNLRAQQVLKRVIERYIQHGQPVGSKTLATEAELNLSAATLRNVLAKLEQLGYLYSPHTSAGRIPTVLGYRFFINSLMAIKPLDEAMLIRLKQKFHAVAEDGASQVAASASQFLSELTGLTGLVTLPKPKRLRLRHIEFLSLSDYRVLAIVVVNEQEVQNRVIQTERLYSSAELQEAANYLNTCYQGRDIFWIREKLLSAMQVDKMTMDRLMETAITVAAQAISEDKPEGDYFLAGQGYLFDLLRETEVSQLRALFEAFSQKRDILHLLDESLKTEGVQVFIGAESGYQILETCSLITTSYSVDGFIAGALGVIGPTRMAYDQVVSIVDVTAKLLGAALNSTQ